jgi:hypothetical protein
MSVSQSPRQSSPGDRYEPDSSTHSNTVYHLAREWLDIDEQDHSDDHDMDYEPPSESSGSDGDGGADGDNGGQGVGGMISKSQFRTVLSHQPKGEPTEYELPQMTRMT